MLRWHQHCMLQWQVFPFCWKTKPQAVEVSKFTWFYQISMVITKFRKIISWWYEFAFVLGLVESVGALPSKFGACECKCFDGAVCVLRRAWKFQNCLVVDYCRQKMFRNLIRFKFVMSHHLWKIIPMLLCLFAKLQYSFGKFKIINWGWQSHDSKTFLVILVTCKLARGCQKLSAPRQTTQSDLHLVSLEFWIILDLKIFYTTNLNFTPQSSKFLKKVKLNMNESYSLLYIIRTIQLLNRRTSGNSNNKSLEKHSDSWRKIIFMKKCLNFGYNLSEMRFWLHLDCS